MGKMPSRGARKRSIPALTAEERIRGVVRKLRVIEEDHRASGGTVEEWSEILRRLGNASEEEQRAPPHLGLLETFATLLEEWHSNSKFLEDGKPRPLAPTASAQFPGLCRQIGQGRAAKALLQAGLAHGILAETENGRVFPTHRSALVRRPSAMLFDLMSAGISAWQGTVRHNVAPGTDERNRRLDRGIYHQAIPATLEQEYHRVARREFTAPINNLDNWLQAHRASADEPHVVFVCAHAFAGTEEARERRGAKPRRGRPR